MKNGYISLFLATLFLAYSCTESKKEEEKKVVQLPQDQLLTELKTYQDSAKAAWESMIAEDDQKIAYIKRLLEEVSYTPKYNVVLQAKLMEECKALKSKRYDENTILISENIDKYDAATDSLIKGVNALVIGTPNIESYPLAQELTGDIIRLDNNVVVKRIAYDKWAMRYNKLIEEQKPSLEKLGPEYTKLSKKGVFQLES